MAWIHDIFAAALLEVAALIVGILTLGVTGLLLIIFGSVYHTVGVTIAGAVLLSLSGIGCLAIGISSRV